MEEQVKQRLAICESCEHKVSVFCGQCACVIQLKVRIADQSCPEGKW